MSDQDLRRLLEQLHAELQRTDDIDERSRELLRNVTADIERMLARQEGRDARPESLVERLREAVSTFEDSHPTLTETIGNIADALARMGI